MYGCHPCCVYKVADAAVCYYFPSHLGRFVCAPQLRKHRDATPLCSGLDCGT